MKVSCPATGARCAGKAQLIAPGKKPKPLTASSTYKIRPGKAIRVRLELNARGKRFVRAHHRKAIVVLRAGSLPATRTTIRIRY